MSIIQMTTYKRVLSNNYVVISYHRRTDKSAGLSYN